VYGATARAVLLIEQNENTIEWKKIEENPSDTNGACRRRFNTDRSSTAFWLSHGNDSNTFSIYVRVWNRPVRGPVPHEVQRAPHVRFATKSADSQCDFVRKGPSASTPDDGPRKKNHIRVVQLYVHDEQRDVVKPAPTRQAIGARKVKPDAGKTSDYKYVWNVRETATVCREWRIKYSRRYNNVYCSVVCK